MRIGDLIRFTPEPDDYPAQRTDTRELGTILKFDTYSSQVGTSFTKEPILHIIWSDGTVGWILKSRVSKLNA